MTRLEDLNREIRILDDSLVRLKYIGARSIIIAASILVLLPFYFFSWWWPNVLGACLGIFSMAAGYRVNKERKRTRNSVNEIHSKLK